MKAEGKKISMLTAYDYSMAELLDQAGVDGILVGDSMSMVVQGHENTLPVTLDEMIYHAEMVGRAVQHRAGRGRYAVSQLPPGGPQSGEECGADLKRARCQAVKLEGGAEQAEVIAGLVSAGIPVMAHVGLRPQNVHQLGGYQVQRDRDRLVADAQAAEAAGAFSVVLECIPAAIAQEITSQLRIPTIGIGAGADCDGQVLVLHDLLGITSGHVPRHVRKYADLRSIVLDAVQSYQMDVRRGDFPGEENSFR